MNAKITRKTIVGYGYTSACEQVWNKSMTASWLQPEETTAPIHTGTIKQVLQAISDDRTLASYSGGTMYSRAWFVKIGGKFHRITTPSDELGYMLDELTSKRKDYYDDDSNDYVRDVIFVDIK